MSISFHFQITNPFIANYDWENLYYRNVRLFTNKVFEVQIMGYEWKNLLEIDFNWSDRTIDHSGIELNIRFMGFGGILSFYDARHANERSGWFDLRKS